MEPRPDWPHPVLIDRRVGSGDLLYPLRALGVPAETAVPDLEYGDISMVGRGPEDRPITLGIEIKTLGDLLSVITDRRFTGHQLPGLLASYEMRWLLVEGVMTADYRQELQVLKSSRGQYATPKYEWSSAPGGWQRPWKYEDVESWRTSMERAGMRRADTADRRGTATWLAALYRNWTKPWEDHAAHLGVQSKDLALEGEVGAYSLDAFKVTRKMRVAMALEKGVGRSRAEAASRHFRSPREMLNADATEWVKVEGFGKKMAVRMETAATEEEVHE